MSDTVTPAPVVESLPPGPGMPRSLQTLGMLTRQRPWLERNRRRFGDVFTIKLHRFPALVVLADPDLIKQTFTAKPRRSTPAPAARSGPCWARTRCWRSTRTATSPSAVCCSRRSRASA